MPLRDVVNTAVVPTILNVEFRCSTKLCFLVIPAKDRRRDLHLDLQVNSLVIYL